MSTLITILICSTCFACGYIAQSAVIERGWSLGAQFAFAFATTLLVFAVGLAGAFLI